MEDTGSHEKVLSRGSFRQRFVALARLSPLRTMTLWRLPRHDGDTFAVRLDSRQLRLVAQSEVGHIDKSILMPDPVSNIPYEAELKLRALEDAKAATEVVGVKALRCEPEAGCEHRGLDLGLEEGVRIHRRAV